MFYSPTKQRLSSTKLHGVTSQKTVILTLTSVVTGTDNTTEVTTVVFMCVVWCECVCVCVSICTFYTYYRHVLRSNLTI